MRTQCTESFGRSLKEVHKCLITPLMNDIINDLHSGSNEILHAVRHYYENALSYQQGVRGSLRPKLFVRFETRFGSMVAMGLVGI